MGRTAVSVAVKEDCRNHRLSHPQWETTSRFANAGGDSGLGEGPGILVSRLLRLEISFRLARQLRLMNRGIARWEKPMALSATFDDALVYAANLHRDQVRKGSGNSLHRPSDGRF